MRMWLATWWYEDGLPMLELPPWSALQGGQVLAAPASDQPHDTPPHRVYRLFHGRVVVGQVDVALLATWDDVVQTAVQLPAGSRRLALSSVQGRNRNDGLAPLLAAVVRAESPPATRIWLWCHERDRTAAINAGFQVIGRVDSRRASELRILGLDVGERTPKAAALFGLTLRWEE